MTVAPIAAAFIHQRTATFNHPCMALTPALEEGAALPLKIDAVAAGTAKRACRASPP